MDPTPPETEASTEAADADRPNYIPLIDAYTPKLEAGAEASVEAASRLLELLDFTFTQIPRDKARALAARIVNEGHEWRKILMTFDALAAERDEADVMRNARQVKAIMDLGITEATAFVIAYRCRPEEMVAKETETEKPGPLEQAVMQGAELIKKYFMAEAACPRCEALKNAADTLGGEGVEDILGRSRRPLTYCFWITNGTTGRVACGQPTTGIHPVTAELAKVTCLACQAALTKSGVVPPPPPAGA